MIIQKKVSRAVPGIWAVCYYYSAHHFCSTGGKPVSLLPSGLGWSGVAVLAMDVLAARRGRGWLAPVHLGGYAEVWGRGGDLPCSRGLLGATRCGKSPGLVSGVQLGRCLMNLSGNNILLTDRAAGCHSTAPCGFVTHR